MRHPATLLLGVLLFYSSFAYANEYNAGIVEGLWYSKEPVFAGETVRMYVALRNNTGSDLTGRIIFYDNDQRLSSQAVSALNGRIIEAWTDWNPEAGAHELRVELSDVTLDSIDGTDRKIEVPDSTVTDSMYVDIDTDGDGIGNSDDEDDDNDGVSDVDENENGTDPLTPEKEAEDVESPTEPAEGEAPSQNNSNSSSDTDDVGAEGLEQYLKDGALRSSLSGLTQFFENTRNDLDSYRAQRDTHLQQAVRADDGQFTAASASTTPGGSVGEITRTTLPQPEQGWGEKIMQFVKKNLQALYSSVLLIASAGLARPLLLQVLLLVLILLLVYKLARRLGARGD